MVTEYIICNATTHQSIAIVGNTFPTCEDVYDMSLDSRNGDTIELVQRSYDMVSDLTGLKNPSCDIKVMRRTNIAERVIESRVFGWSKKTGFFWKA